MPPANEAPPSTQPALHPPSWWTPRFWLGCNFLALVRLFARNKFKIGLRHAYIAVADVFYSLLNSILGMAQRVIYSRRVARTEIREQPLFILGHWRCGTTLLHELLILDRRHTFPTTWECFAPNHFLLTEWLAVRLLGFMLPEQRPMDDMPLGWDRPQEDEFAFTNLGLPSPYATIAFPNNPPQFEEYFDLEAVPAADRQRWKQALVTFLRQITYRTPKRIILKSPPHTSRIKVLLEMFPDARFVYIVRNPYKVFPSTVHLWKSLYATHALQTPRFEGLEEYVFETFNQMFRKYEETRGLIAPQRLYELKYEDLIADPVGQMRSLYERLELGGFDDVRPAIEAYFAERKEYRPNRYPQSETERAQIRRHWKDYFQRYGYDDRTLAFDFGKPGESPRKSPAAQSR